MFLHGCLLVAVTVLMAYMVDDPLTSQTSDVWAFALTILEVVLFI